MEQVRVPEGGSYTLTRLDGWPKFLAERLSRMEADIQEVNVLAGKIDQIGRESIPWYEGVISCVESERGGRECSVKDLINAADNLEYFGLLPWIVNDTDLGECAVDGGTVGMLQGLPDEVLAFLDKEKVGACLRKTENGVFTKEGYCYRVKEGWQEICNGQNLPEQAMEEDAILSVRLENRKHPEHGKVWLSLPCSTEKMASACTSLHAESLEQCRIWEARSAVPILEKKIQFYDDAEVLNELAERLQQMPQNELIKYKAVLQFENWRDIEEALLLTERLDCYVFDPSQISYEHYGRKCLEDLGGGVDCSDSAFRNFDFAEYGMNRFDAAGMGKTNYGWISSAQKPELLEAPEDSRQMRGNDFQMM